MLTDDQKIALTGLLDFVTRPIESFSDCSTVLYAAAGCGKTYLTRKLVDKLRGQFRVAGVAPTHKARKVLDKFLNQDSFYTIKTLTVASLLNKLRSHSYIGTKNYKGAGNKLDLYDVFIIDEASMITDGDIKKIIRYAFDHRRKVIFVGDKYQIPNPSQSYSIQVDGAYRKDSCVFNIPGFELTTNLRQRKGNPIVDLYWEMRSAIQQHREPDIPRESKITDGIGVEFFTDREEWYNQIKALLKPSFYHDFRIIAYTNDAVRTHNQTIRRQLGKGIEPEKGELLMGYTNIGYPKPYLSNGQDYYIVRVKKSTNYTVLKYHGLVGLILTVQETNSSDRADLFIPDISSHHNQDLLNELVRRAEKVNRMGSSKMDFKKYSELRNKVIFMDDIYKFRGEIISSSELRNSHPLLFRRVEEVISPDRIIINNKLSQHLTESYPTLLDNRRNDTKPITEVEKLCDSLCILERDIDYGYAITAHKSQASTFQTVFIDEYDFEKIKDHWDYQLGCEIKSIKEKTQLKYVSYTRPTHSAYVFYREVV